MLFVQQRDVLVSLVDDAQDLQGRERKKLKRDMGTEIKIG